MVIRVKSVPSIIHFFAIFDETFLKNCMSNYDGKCKNCPGVWLEGSGGLPG